MCDAGGRTLPPMLPASVKDTSSRCGPTRACCASLASRATVRWSSTRVATRAPGQNCATSAYAPTAELRQQITWLRRADACEHAAVGLSRLTPHAVGLVCVIANRHMLTAS